MSRTAKILEALTDSGQFEELSNAVLRMAEHDYRGIIGTGCSTDGKTVKSPVDGIYFVPGTSPTKVIAVHHSTCARGDLKKKWLYDNSTKKRRTKTPDGDIIKTINWAVEECKRTPDIQVTLVLTTNRIPADSLICMAKAKCKEHKIDVDFWDNSRISCYLDNNPDGQWLRKKYLGIKQERLSEDLLREISEKSLNEYESSMFVKCKSALVNRKLDIDLSEEIRNTNSSLTLLVAESGFGKSIACLRLLENHINNGGYGIHVPHEMISSDYMTLDSVVENTLSSFCPVLETGSAAKIKIMKKDKSFLIVIDDINRSIDTESILKKLISWLCKDQKSNDTPSIKKFPNIHVICPVWPHNLKKVGDILEKVEVSFVSGKAFEPDEARTAIKLASQNPDRSLSQLEIKNIAKNLNYDPLLIGLWSDSVDQMLFSEIANQPNQIISNYVVQEIKELASIDMDAYLESEYLYALNALCEHMLVHRVLEPNWNQVLEWFKNEGDIIKRLRKLLRQKTILYLDEPSERIIFRHDRIRDYILVHSICSLMQNNKLNNIILEEPYYAELIGLALVIVDLESKWVKSVKDANPLALFYALKLFSNPSTDWQNEICSAIDNWLDEYSKSTCLPGLQNEIELVLSETDSPLVNKICDRLNHRSWYILEARFRNGDVSAGAYYCYRIEPSTTSLRRDLLIEHVYTKYGIEVVAKLTELLLRNDMGVDLKKGALNLCGYLASPDLIPAIEKCWHNCEPNLDILSSAIWAAARCSHANPEAALDPIFDYWNTLSDTENKYGGSDVIDVAYYGLCFAFKHYSLQEEVVSYFIKKTESEKLHWPLTIILEKIDNPDAIEFVVREAAKIAKRLENSDRISPWLMTLQQNWDTKTRFNNAIKLCDVSKKRLFDLWINEKESVYVRKWAMKIWVVSTNTEHIEILREIHDSSPFYDLALQRRMVLGDPTVEDEVIKKLETAKHPTYWWQFCHHCWGPQLKKAVDVYFSQCFDDTNNVDKEKSESSDWAISNLLIRIPIAEAESLIVKYWEQIQYIVGYFQAALYVGTEKCRTLAFKAIKNHSEPEKLFEHIDSKFGFRAFGLQDLITQNHLDSLEPYLDFLSDMAIWDIWAWCNKRGFFEWRQNYLDKRLSKKWQKRECFTDEANFEELDKFAEKIKKGHIFSYRWLEHFEERNDNKDRPMALLSGWLCKRKTLDAFNVAADIISIGGSRSDLSILDVTIPGANQEEIRFIREDANYRVKRRTLK